MARITVDEDDVVVRLAWRERIVARRHEVRVSLADVKDVKVEQDGWRAIRGVCRRGRWSPGRFCLGEWGHPEGTDFVAVRIAGPVVMIDLWRSAPYTRLSVTVPGPEDVARTLRGRRDDHRSGRRAERPAPRPAPLFRRPAGADALCDAVDARPRGQPTGRTHGEHRRPGPLCMALP